MIRKKQIIFILIFLFSAVVFARENQVTPRRGDPLRAAAMYHILAISAKAAKRNENSYTVNEDKKLKEEITAAYASGGEESLRNFVRGKIEILSSEFIVSFAKRGLNKLNKNSLEISEILAEEKKDKKTLADVYLGIGEFYRLTSDYKKAAGYLNESLQIYVKLNDPVFQGNVYLKMGIIYYSTGNHSKALEMYIKAKHFFEKTDDQQGQGQCKGT